MQFRSMVPRMPALTQANSFFLFGTGRVGKTTLINALQPDSETARFNILDFELESRLLRNPAGSSARKLRRGQANLLATHDIDIDLVIERPGQSTILLEIKSTDHVQSKHVSALASLASDAPNSRALYVSRDPIRRMIGEVLACSYADLLQELVI